MKGTSPAIEFMGKVLISVFIIGVIIILLMTFLPSIFFDNFCRDKQAETINDIFTDASSTRATTVRAFVVESCVEHIDFANVVCISGVGVGSPGQHRCYEVLYVGESESNCGEVGISCDRKELENCLRACSDRDKECNDRCEAVVCDSNEDATQYCSSHKGLFAPLPGGPLTFDIQPHPGSGWNLRYKPGKYLVEIGPYSIKFLDEPS